jgi:hypothetical protein
LSHKGRCGFYNVLPPPAQRGQKSHLAGTSRGGHAHRIEETVITREEVVALLFNVSDMAVSLARIERLLEEDDGEEDDTG